MLLGTFGFRETGNSMRYGGTTNHDRFQPNRAICRMARQASADGCEASKQKWRESAGAVFNTSGLGVSGETENKGKYNETSDEIYGQHHSVAVAKWVYGHGNQALEWWALYFREKERGLPSVLCRSKSARPSDGEK